MARLINKQLLSFPHEHACDKSFKKKITDKKTPQSSGKNLQWTKTTTPVYVNKTECKIQFSATLADPKVKFIWFIPHVYEGNILNQRYFCFWRVFGKFSSIFKDWFLQCKNPSTVLQEIFMTPGQVILKKLLYLSNNVGVNIGYSKITHSTFVLSTSEILAETQWGRNPVCWRLCQTCQKTSNKNTASTSQMASCEVPACCKPIWFLWIQ